MSAPAKVSQIQQRSPEWYTARCGSLGASQIADVMAKTKSGYSTSRANVMAQLLCERLTGCPTESFINAAMQWGIDTEAEARSSYCFLMDAEVSEVGLIHHPELPYTHCSPDGLVGTDGLVEIKCPNTAQHLEHLLSETVPQKYILQMQWQMRCAGRAWCDFVSYDPRVPEHLRMFCKRVTRDDALIDEIEAEVTKFLRELAEKILALDTKYPRAA
jgi:putative phage-type endonuclease